MGACCTTTKVKESSQELEVNNDEHDQETTEESLCPEFSISDFTIIKKLGSDKETFDGTVYEAETKNVDIVVVKKLNPKDWPHKFHFVSEAYRVYELKHRRFAKFLGYCCSDEDKNDKTRLLVAEFLPYDNLAKRLFHEKKETMEWGLRLRDAYCVAEAVDFCSNRSLSYNNLSAYSVLVDKDGDACLSCFGLVTDINTSQIAPAESVTYRFGVVLLNLLTGKKIPPSHAHAMIKRKNVIDLMDPNLEGKFVDEEATVVFDIANKCLYEEKESLNIKEIVATLEAMQKTEKHEEEASSSSHQGQLESMQTKSEIPTVEIEEEVSSSIQQSPLGEACLKGDLNAINPIMAVAVASGIAPNTMVDQVPNQPTVASTPPLIVTQVVVVAIGAVEALQEHPNSLGFNQTR